MRHSGNVDGGRVFDSKNCLVVSSLIARPIVGDLVTSDMYNNVMHPQPGTACYRVSVRLDRGGGFGIRQIFLLRPSAINAVADFIKVASLRAALGDTETPLVTHFG